MTAPGRALAPGPPGPAIDGPGGPAGRLTGGPPGRMPGGPAGGPAGRRAGRTAGGLAGRMLGPAFIASVAYVDPGNFATSIEGGSRYGYLLLWVVLAASLTAMGVQYLAAKLGIVTGLGLPEFLAGRGPRGLTFLLWAQAEIVAMATDIAEFVGAALGLQLLFGLPPLAGGAATGVIAFGLLGLRRAGCRRFEAGIAALLAVVFAGFGYEVLNIGPDARASLHGLVPGLNGGGSAYLAAGILGATVMPHVIYLHSALAASSSRSSRASYPSPGA
ncbi:MAG: Nramp family divalent metal transporter, partial [Nocardiopsaceae bacterium]|nr:Nramp family divalent metal transporter [Nocardiopsaceae bacterium]